MAATCHLQPGQRAIVLSGSLLEHADSEVLSDYQFVTDSLSTEDVVILCGELSTAGVPSVPEHITQIIGDRRLTYLVVAESVLEAITKSLDAYGVSSDAIYPCSSLELTYEDHGSQRLLIEPGGATSLSDPRSAVLERLSQQGRRFRDATQLDPRASIARYVVSRSFYRRIRLLLVWVTIPLLIVLAIRIPILLSLPIFNQRPTSLVTSTELIGMTFILDAILAITVSAFTSRSMLRVLDVPLGTALQTIDPNGAERLRLDQLLAQGYRGLITGSTRTKELLRVGDGVFACPGNFAQSVERLTLRLPLPAVYAARADISWLEIEPGATLRISLWSYQRLLAHSRFFSWFTSHDLRKRSPRLIAALPGGPTYSPITKELRTRTLAFRRMSALAVFFGGLIELATALIPPLQRHLRLVAELFPSLDPYLRDYANALAAAAGVGMIAVAFGLHAGRRRSYEITLAIGVVAFLANLARGGDLGALVVLGVVLAVLFFNRHSFDQPTLIKPSLSRLLRLLVTIVILLFVADIATIAGRLLLNRHHPYGLVPALGRVIGVSLGLIDQAPFPFNHPYLRDALQLSMFVILLAIIWTIISPLSSRVHLDTRTDPSWQSLHHTLTSHPQSTLDYFALRDDKLHWVRHGVLIAYGIFGSTVIVSPDPIGPRSSARLAFVEFFAEMKRQGRSVAILGATAEWQLVYQYFNMRSYYIGDEAIVQVGSLDLAGKRHKSLRQAVNRMAKYGYSVTVLNPTDLVADDRDQVLAIMAASRRGDRERGFSMTLGRIFDNRDRDLLMSVCRDGEGTITGFCQWVPAPAVNGYSLDLMRRDLGEHPNGMFDLLIVETMRQLGEWGYDALSLNFAAMRAVLAGERGSGIPSRVERWVLGRLSDSMQIESLWHFNSKFDPTWLPRYLVVDSIENLPAIAIAAGKAESLWDLPVIGRFLSDAPRPEQLSPT